MAADIPTESRLEAARLAFALLRFAGVAAHPQVGVTPPAVPKLGTEAYVFGPSWRRVPLDEVEAFLAELPSPALLIPTVTRGEITLILINELTGERRRWGEKTLSNFVACFDENVSQLGLSPTARVLVEFDDESHIFSLATVREWAQQLAVNVGWNIRRLEGDEADACLMLIRADGQPFPGRSCMIKRLRGVGDGAA